MDLESLNALVLDPELQVLVTGLGSGHWCNWFWIGVTEIVANWFEIRSYRSVTSLGSKVTGCNWFWMRSYRCNWFWDTESV